MKFSVAREALLKPLQAVIGVVERRQTMPILSNVLLLTKDNELSVTATDLEVELVARGGDERQEGITGRANYWRARSLFMMGRRIDAVVVGYEDARSLRSHRTGLRWT